MKTILLCLGLALALPTVSQAAWGGFYTASRGASGNVNITGTFDTPATAISGTDIDWNLAHYRTKTLSTASTEFTFSNQADGRWLKVRLIQDATGDRAASWPSPSVIWVNSVDQSTAPTINTNANAVTFYYFHRSGSTTYAWMDSSDSQVLTDLANGSAWSPAGQFRITDGTAGEPSIVLATDDDGTGTGIYRLAANDLAFAVNGEYAGSAQVNGFVVGGGKQFGSQSSGAALNFASGGGSSGNATLHTSSGTKKDILFGRGSSTIHGALWSGAATTLTESTATTIGNILLASGKFLTARAVVTVNAGDGTDLQTRILTFDVAAVNKAGTATITLGTPVETVAVSAGTLTCTITVVANPAAPNTTSLDIKADATSSLTQTTLAGRIDILSLQSDGTSTISRP